MQFEELLAEADSGRYIIIDHDTRLPERGRGWIDVDAKITCIAHQEEWGELSENIPQPCQPGAHAHILLGFSVAG